MKAVIIAVVSLAVVGVGPMLSTQDPTRQNQETETTGQEVKRIPNRHFANEASFGNLETPQDGNAPKPTQDEQQPGSTTRPLMRAKLVSAQRVLDGLVSEDFDMIRKGAANMKSISVNVEWPQADDKVYEHFSTEFRNQCDKLVELADSKNLEGVHYTYLSMTTTCVNCHNYVRGRFRVERDRGNTKVPVRLIPTEWDDNESPLKK